MICLPVFCRLYTSAAEGGTIAFFGVYVRGDSLSKIPIPSMSLSVEFLCETIQRELYGGHLGLLLVVPNTVSFDGKRQEYHFKYVM